MAIKLKAICSECLTLHKAKLEFGQENIQCPACGHAMRNLPESELAMIESTQKSQKTNNIIAIIAFLFAIAGFLFWSFHQYPEMYYYLQGAEPVPKDDMRHTVYPSVCVIGLILALVFSVLGARKRFVLEF